MARWFKRMLFGMAIAGVMLAQANVAEGQKMSGGNRSGTSMPGRSGGNFKPAVQMPKNGSIAQKVTPAVQKGAPQFKPAVQMPKNGSIAQKVTPAVQKGAPQVQKSGIVGKHQAGKPGFGIPDVARLGQKSHWLNQNVGFRGFGQQRHWVSGGFGHHNNWIGGGWHRPRYDFCGKPFHNPCWRPYFTSCWAPMTFCQPICRVYYWEPIYCYAPISPIVCVNALACEPTVIVEGCVAAALPEEEGFIIPAQTTEAQPSQALQRPRDDMPPASSSTSQVVNFDSRAVTASLINN